MCTLVVLFRPGHAWPICLAANRDESIERAWDPPAAWWPEHRGIVAGRDRTAGGTWMGVNERGVAAAVLNRAGSLGPAAGKRSRGELPLMALAESDIDASLRVIGSSDCGQWRGFNLVVANRAGAHFIRGAGAGPPRISALAAGVTMITAHDPNDLDSARVARHLPRFRAAAAPEPANWEGWRAILADRSGTPAEQINVTPRGGFGTVCSSFLAIPAEGDAVWLFAAGAPHEAAFEPVRAMSAASRP